MKRGRNDSQDSSLNPQLARKGDEIERGHWGHFRKLVPHYESVWQQHVYPLRIPGQIWLRDGLDPEFESFAIMNYSTFVALCRARQKIFVKTERYKFIEELYGTLQRSCELGIKLIKKFDMLYESLTGRHSSISERELEKLIVRRLSEYRNLLHDEMISTPKDLQKRRLIPRIDKIAQYRNWTAVMYHMNPADFVVAADQLKSDFHSVCSHLEDVWKAIDKESKPIVDLVRYTERRGRGTTAGSVIAPVSVSGASLH